MQFRPDPRGLCFAAIAVAGCTAPDFGPTVTETRFLLSETIADARPGLEQRASEEQRQAELAAARERRTIVTLPGDCAARIADSLSVDVSDCQTLAPALPLDGRANATQVLRALTVMEGYFAGLEGLATADSPEAIRTQTAALMAAIGGLGSAGDTSPFARLADRATRDGPVLSATAGFAADQARIAALRRVMQAADPELERLIEVSQTVLIDAGDPALAGREAVMDAFAAYTKAQATGSASDQIRSAQILRARVEAMHAAEAVSPIRRLYLVRQMHGALLTRLLAGPGLDELDRITTQISEINNLL